MFTKKRESKLTTDDEFHKATMNKVENNVREIMENIENTPQFVTTEQITSGFLIGYDISKRLYEKSIDHIAEENRKLKYENLVFKNNNESLAKQNLELLEICKKLDKGNKYISSDDYDRYKSDALSYFELFP